MPPVTVILVGNRTIKPSSPNIKVVQVQSPNDIPKVK